MSHQNGKPKKILQISSYPPPRAGWGIRVSFLKTALIEAGHACDVINIAPESRKIPSPEYLTSMNGLDYMWKCLKLSMKGYRVHMHLNGNSPKGFILTIMAEIANLLTFKRPILTVHAGPNQIYFPRENAPKLIPMFKFIFGVARKVICNSEAVRQKIIEYGVKPEKVVPIQAFSRQYLQFIEQPVNGELKAFIERSSPLISSYVFFRPEFFIDDMVKGIAELTKEYPNIGLMILGSHDNSEEIRALVKELGIEKNVFYAGDQNHDSFLSLVTASDFCLRTPVRDGVSSSVLEALALGVPVVASENNRRPPSVVTYDHESIPDMVRVLRETIENLPAVKAAIVKPDIMDTVAEEVSVLVEV